MIKEPQTMGTMTIDRKLQKPVYFQLQRQYGSLLGDLTVEIKEPTEGQALNGKVAISAEIKGREKPEAVELIIEGKSLGKLSMKAVATDDKVVTSVTYSVDGGEVLQMESIGEGDYQATWDASGLPDGSAHELKFTATDTGNQTAEAKAKVTIDNKPGQYVGLPFDHDWISWNK